MGVANFAIDFQKSDRGRNKKGKQATPLKWAIGLKYRTF
jgi:hypothetical protein